MSNDQRPQSPAQPAAEPPASGAKPKEPTAWQPLTAGGVAAFGDARAGRLFLVQFLVAIGTAAIVVWFLTSHWFPLIRQAIHALPEAGEIRAGRLEWAGVSPERLAETRFLALAVDLEHTGQVRSPAHFYVEFGRSQLKIFSLLGYHPVPYPRGQRIGFNRDVLVPWWGAWSPVLLAFTVGSVICGLMLSWAALATLYAVPVWLTAFYRNRQLTVGGAWRLSGAALVPGGLFMCAILVLYGMGVLDLVRLAIGLGAHFIIGWIYLWMAAARVPMLPEFQSGKNNPFDSNAAATNQ